MNVVLEAIEAEDRATAERWAERRFNAAYAGELWTAQDPAVQEAEIEAMLPLVREARQARADALVEHSGAGWAVVAQIGKALGLPEDASAKDILDAVGRLTAPVDVDAEVDALASAEAGVFWVDLDPAEKRVRMAKYRPIVERCARLRREVTHQRGEALGLARVLKKTEKYLDASEAERAAQRAEIARLKSALGAALARCAEIADGWSDTSAGKAIAEDIRVLAAVESPARVVSVDVNRLTWLTEHGGTTEQVNARAELMRLGLRPRPGPEQPAPALTEEEARAWVVNVLRFVPVDPEHAGDEEVLVQALLAAYRRDIPAEVRPGAIRDFDDAELHACVDCGAVLGPHDWSKHPAEERHAAPEMAVTTGEPPPDSVDPRDLPTKNW